MAVPTLPTLESERSPTTRPMTYLWLVGAVLLLPIVLFVLGILIRGGVGLELQQISTASLQALPFMVLAVLSYVGLKHLWGKVAAIGWLALLLGGGALGLVFASFATMVDTSNLAAPGLIEGNGLNLGLLVLAMPVAVLVAAAGFLLPVRRWASRFLPLDPDSFVHTIMLVAIVGLTLICFLPLAMLGEPLLLTLLARASETGADLTGGRDTSGQLRDTLYGLVWIIPAALFAVGYGITRTGRSALARLGLVRPTVRQVAAALGIAVALVIAVGLLSAGVDWLWGVTGWTKTDGEAFGELLAFAVSPIGAVVIGITAGLGEELAVRGVLQPRAGILLSNLFFTSLHALQYNWDSLLIVFVVGLVLGVVRKRTNTTTSAIVHGVYDFLLILASALSVPWFSE